MQEDKKEKKQNILRLDTLPAEDGRNFVNAFAWLFKEAKKQNLAIYQIKKQDND